MSDEPRRRNVRRAIEGADRAFQVIDGGAGARRPPDDPGPDGELRECPVLALGVLDGICHFLDAMGAKRELSARQLGSRADLVLLFRGDDSWLRVRFPRYAMRKIRDDRGEETTEQVVVDFSINAAAAWLIQQCAAAGIYGDHVVLRPPGVWRDADGAPVVHSGDVVLIGGRMVPSGQHLAGQIWAAAAPAPRPSTPCDASIGAQLQQQVQDLWNFREPGGAIAALGVVATGLYGAAAEWRSSAFVLGGAGSGKTQLHQVLRAMAPLHHYSNDTSKAGLEQAVDGRAMPIFLDEASDKADQRGAITLLDMVLAASGGEGLRGVRGSINGRSRKIEITGAVIMAATNPPDMRDTHLGRFTLIELGRPNGEDFREQHRALIAETRRQGPAIWGRMLASWERYQAALRSFRLALGEHGCQPREMDQLSAILAGWWVLTREGAAEDRGALEGVRALADMIRTAEDVRQDSAPQAMLRHLLGSLVQLDRSTDREQLGRLIEMGLRGSTDGRDMSTDHLRRLLGNYGVRVIRRGEDVDIRGRPVPRMADGFGVWFSAGSAELRKLFVGTSFEGDRWRFEMRRLESAREAKFNVRIGTVAGRATWVSAEELGFEMDAPANGDQPRAW